MGENRIIWKQLPDSDEGKIYNSFLIDPMAVYIGRMLNELEDEHNDEAYKVNYQNEAIELYELAHAQPEWLKSVKDSPWYKYTEAYQRDCEYEEKMQRLNEYYGDPGDEDDRNMFVYSKGMDTEESFEPDTDQIVSPRQAQAYFESSVLVEEDDDEQD